MKILFIMDAMHYGGAAKKATSIANELSRRGHEVGFVTNTYYPIGFPLEDAIEIVPLYEKEETYSNRIIKVLHKLKRVRSIVSKKEPNVVITVLPHVSFYVKVALLGKKTPIVFSDETSFARKDTRFVHFIRHRFYNYADAVIILTENDARLLGNNIPRKVVIHNPVVCPAFNERLSNKDKIVLAIGPLNEWYIKGFDLLFQAFSRISSKYPEWAITIAGDISEPYRSNLMEMADKEHIQDRIRFLGFRKDIYDVMRASSVFALSSRVEGFSLAFVESLSQGCACVAFSNHGVINEVSCGGKGVMIVDDGDVEGFAVALDKVISNESLRLHMVEDGSVCVESYSIDKITDKWEKVLNDINEGRHKSNGTKK